MPFFTLSRSRFRARLGSCVPADMNADLLALLRCPATRQPLALAERAVIERLNAQAAAGQLRNAAGHSVTIKLDDGLVRADGAALYPVRNNVPVLLVDEAIALR